MPVLLTLVNPWQGLHSGSYLSATNDPPTYLLVPVQCLYCLHWSTHGKDFTQRAADPLCPCASSKDTMHHDTVTGDGLAKWLRTGHGGYRAGLHDNVPDRPSAKAAAPVGCRLATMALKIKTVTIPRKGGLQGRSCHPVSDVSASRLLHETGGLSATLAVNRLGHCPGTLSRGCGFRQQPFPFCLSPLGVCVCSASSPPDVR